MYFEILTGLGGFALLGAVAALHFRTAANAQALNNLDAATAARVTQAEAQAKLYAETRVRAVEEALDRTEGFWRQNVGEVAKASAGAIESLSDQVKRVAKRGVEDTDNKLKAFDERLQADWAKRDEEREAKRQEAIAKFTETFGTQLQEVVGEMHAKTIAALTPPLEAMVDAVGKMAGSLEMAETELAEVKALAKDNEKGLEALAEYVAKLPTSLVGATAERLARPPAGPAALPEAHPLRADQEAAVAAIPTSLLLSAEEREAIESYVPEPKAPSEPRNNFGRRERMDEGLDLIPGIQVARGAL